MTTPPGWLFMWPMVGGGGDKRLSPLSGKRPEAAPDDATALRRGVEGAASSCLNGQAAWARRCWLGARRCATGRATGVARASW